MTKPIPEMTIADLLAFVGTDIESERNLAAVLDRASKLAWNENRALGLLLTVLSEEPPEVAAGWSHHLAELGPALHPDTNGPALCRIASYALAQFSEQDETNSAEQHMGGAPEAWAIILSGLVRGMGETRDAAWDDARKEGRRGGFSLDSAECVRATPADLRAWLAGDPVDVEAAPRCYLCHDPLEPNPTKPHVEVSGKGRAHHGCAVVEGKARS